QLATPADAAGEDHARQTVLVAAFIIVLLVVDIVRFGLVHSVGEREPHELAAPPATTCQQNLRKATILVAAVQANVNAFVSGHVLPFSGLGGCNVTVGPALPLPRSTAHSIPGLRLPFCRLLFSRGRMGGLMRLAGAPLARLHHLPANEATENELPHL